MFNKIFRCVLVLTLSCPQILVSGPDSLQETIDENELARLIVESQLRQRGNMESGAFGLRGHRPSTAIETQEMYDLRFKVALDSVRGMTPEARKATHETLVKKLKDIAKRSKMPSVKTSPSAIASGEFPMSPTSVSSGGTVPGLLSPVSSISRPSTASGQASPRSSSSPFSSTSRASDQTLPAVTPGARAGRSSYPPAVRGISQSGYAVRPVRPSSARSKG